MVSFGNRYNFSVIHPALCIMHIHFLPCFSHFSGFVRPCCMIVLAKSGNSFTAKSVSSVSWPETLPIIFEPYKWLWLHLGNLILFRLFHIMASNQLVDCVISLCSKTRLFFFSYLSHSKAFQFIKWENNTRTLDESTPLFNFSFSGGRHNYWDQAGAGSILIKNKDVVIMCVDGCTAFPVWRYLILVSALLELFELWVEYSELPGDALDPCVEAPVLAVLCVEVVFVTLTLLLWAYHGVLSVKETKRKYHHRHKSFMLFFFVI